MKSLRYLGFIVVIAISFWTCDYVEEPYILQGPNGCNTPEPAFTASTNPVRKVLIEDFTGHRCGNCPRAAEAIETIQAAYPGRVVAIGMHSAIPSNFTAPGASPFNYDFRRQTATDIDTKFGVSGSGLPIGMVNRKEISGSRSIPYSNWQNTTSGLLIQPPDIEIQIKNFYDASDSTLCSYAYARFLTAIDGKFKLVMYLVENEFHAAQYDYEASPQTIPDYEHNHVFRETITTTWGTLLYEGISAPGNHYVNGYSIKIDGNKYNPANCQVVAFVYDEISNVVIQAEVEDVW